MSHLLVCSVPNPGHVGPMLAVAEHLRSLGHTVTFNTSEHFRPRVESAGFPFLAMEGKANYDYRNIFEGKGHLSVDDQKLHLLRTAFVEPIADQHRVIQEFLRRNPVDLIVVDSMFFGVYPMLLGPREKRPPVIGCGVNPLLLSSCDCELMGPGENTPEGRQKTLEANREIQAQFQESTDLLNEVMRDHGVPPLPLFFVDCTYTLPDRFLQFTAEAFEFPRGDMPDTISFVGPMLPKVSVEFKEPDWWKELDGEKPVVLVTQGTFANHDLNELIQPALHGLADEDVLVIAATGRTDTEKLVVPANARVVSFIPFDRLLPKVDVFVTNGGYGAVNHAFSLGVPIVVAGESEEKGFIAARIGWSGAGINLATHYATPEQVRTAVRSILDDEKYRREARRLQASFARYNALDEIARATASMLHQEEDMAVAAR